MQSHTCTVHIYNYTQFRNETTYSKGTRRSPSRENVYVTKTWRPFIIHRGVTIPAWSQRMRNVMLCYDLMAMMTHTASGILAYVIFYI